MYINSLNGGISGVAVLNRTYLYTWPEKHLRLSTYLCAVFESQRAVEILGRYNPSRSEVLEERRGKSVNALQKRSTQNGAKFCEKGRYWSEPPTISNW